MRSSELKGWQGTAGAICAILMAIVFLVSGVWKIMYPFHSGELLEQAQVPAGWGVLGASTLGSIEVFTALLLLFPQFRRWGGLLASALVIFFLCWVAYYYKILHGQECSCFPLIKRTVGPGFFIGDGVMLLLSLGAFVWSRPVGARVSRIRVPAVLLVAIAALAGLSFGVQAAERSHAAAPNPVIVDGKPQNLNQGKVFLFFYDPSCEFCDASARSLAKLNWSGTTVVGIPTDQPQWAASFLHDTHLKAETSLEYAKLKTAFKAGVPPFAVALDNGRVESTFTQQQLKPAAPDSKLKQLGFIH